jgi:N-acylneuraminate cytidylyltransferase
MYVGKIYPVVKFSYPIQRAFRINDKNFLEFMWFENIKKRSQDLEPAYHDAGQFYWMTAMLLVENKSMVSDNTTQLILNEMEVQDLDTLDDWKLAEMKMSLLTK